MSLSGVWPVQCGFGEAMFFSAIVFDFDGVIVESTDVKTSAFYELALPWGEVAAKQMREYHLAHFGVSRFIKFEWFFRNILGKNITPGENQALSEQFAALCLEKILDAPMVPGFTDVISLAYGHCPLYVASASPQPELEQVLEKRDLSKFFKAIYGFPPKKSESLQRIVDGLQLDPTTVLMVGDSPWDLAAAEEVGTNFYGRGKQFESSGYPWGEDLRNLAVSLAEKLA